MGSMGKGNVLDGNREICLSSYLPDFVYDENDLHSAMAVVLYVRLADECVYWLRGWVWTA